MDKRPVRLTDAEIALVIKAQASLVDRLERMPAGLDPPGPYLALFAHAHFRQAVGPQLYRRLVPDAPRTGLLSQRSFAADHLMHEILKWRGLRRTHPIEDVTRRFFSTGMRYFAYRLLHFSILDVSDEHFTLAEMRLGHTTNGRELRLFLRVRVLMRVRPRTGPPCPHCGERLRTARARQCGQCRTYWQDSADVSQA